MTTERNRLRAAVEYSSELPRRRAAALASSAVLLAVAAALYAAAVGTGEGRRLDAEAFAAIADTALETPAKAFAHLVNVFTAGLAGAALLLVGRRRGVAGAVALLLVGANASAWGLEWALGALDPLGGETHRALGPSYFPSGHATAATSLAVAAVLVTPAARRRCVAIAAASAAALLGFAVVASGWHTPSDVLGAFLLTGAWTGAAIAVTRR